MTETDENAASAFLDEEDEDAEGMGDRVEFFRGVDGLWYFRWVAANNEICCQSEGYQNAADAKAIADKMFQPVPWFQEVDDGWEEVR